MRVKISFGFCAMICVMAWVNTRVCIYFLISAAVHELGHFCALKLCRVPVDGISLKLTGAVLQTVFHDEQSELFCAAAGPVASAILGALCLRWEAELAVISFLLAAVNLLPLFPLDGGRILRAFLRLHCSEQCAEKILRIMTFTVCSILMLLACWGTIYLQAGIWPIFAALVLLWRAGSAEK